MNTVKRVIADYENLNAKGWGFLDHLIAMSVTIIAIPDNKTGWVAVLAGVIFTAFPVSIIVTLLLNAVVSERAAANSTPFKWMRGLRGVGVVVMGLALGMGALPQLAGTEAVTCAGASVFLALFGAAMVAAPAKSLISFVAQKRAEKKARTAQMLDGLRDKLTY